MPKSNERWRKLTIQEINGLWNSNVKVVLDEIIQAYRAGAAFVFGVDKLKDGYRLTINCVLRGIYLTPKIEKLGQERDLSLSGATAIVPDVNRAGTTDWRGEQDVTFYVSPTEFACFCKEAERIFNEYTLKGICFRMIPDLWFSDMALVSFIRERLQSHPATIPWFSGPQLPRSHGIEMSVQFNR